MVRHEDSKKKKKTKGQPFCRSGKLTCRKRPESSKMGMRAEVNTPFWALDSSSCDSRDSIWCLCCWDFLLASWSFLARSVWPEISEDLLLLPELAHRVLRHLAEAGEQGERPNAADRRRFRGRRAAGLRTLAGAAILIAGVLWLGLDVEPVWPGWIAAAGGFALTLWAASPFRQRPTHRRAKSSPR